MKIPSPFNANKRCKERLAIQLAIFTLLCGQRVTFAGKKHRHPSNREHEVMPLVVQILYHAYKDKLKELKKCSFVWLTSSFKRPIVSAVCPKIVSALS